MDKDSSCFGSIGEQSAGIGIGQVDEARTKLVSDVALCLAMLIMTVQGPSHHGTVLLLFLASY
jgi:hypothetical protein